MSISIPETLEKQVVSGNCILFVGAGLSQTGTNKNGNPLPLWNELLNEMLKRTKREGRLEDSDYEQIEKSINNQRDYPEIADVLRSKLGGALFKDFMLEVFDGAQPGQIHKVIPDMSFRAILTTNFDKLIEEGFQSVGRSVRSYNLTNITPSDFQHDNPLVLQLHGNYEETNSIILGTKDFNRVLSDNKKQDLISALFLLHPVVFVGYGARKDDIDIRNTLRNLKAKWPQEMDYYLLSKRGEFGITKKTLNEEYKLQVIEYSDHSEVFDAFKKLRNLAAKQTSDNAMGLPRQTEEILERNSQSPFNKEKYDFHIEINRFVAKHSRRYPTWIKIQGGIGRIGAQTRRASENFDNDAEANEGPVHNVFTGPFEVGKYHVTINEYLAFIESGGYCNSYFWSIPGWKWREKNHIEKPKDWEAQKANPYHPVVSISFHEAQAYCNWLNITQASVNQYRHSIMTEAEWEYLARQDSKGYKPYCINNGVVDEELNCYRTPPFKLAPVGLFPNDRAGEVMDTNGNAREWTHKSKYEDELLHAGEYDPTELEKVLKGGGFLSSPEDCRTAKRQFISREERPPDVGFRVKRTPFPISNKGYRPTIDYRINLADFFYKHEDLTTEDFNRLRKSHSGFDELFDSLSDFITPRRASLKAWPCLLGELPLKKRMFDLRYQDSRIKIEAEKPWDREKEEIIALEENIAKQVEELLEVVAVCLRKPVELNKPLLYELTDNDLDALVYTALSSFNRGRKKRLLSEAEKTNKSANNVLEPFVGSQSIADIPLEEIVDIQVRSGATWWQNDESVKRLCRNERGLTLDDVSEFRERVLNCHTKKQILFIFNDNGECVFDLTFILHLLHNYKHLHIIGVVNQEVVANDVCNISISNCFAYRLLSEINSLIDKDRFRIFQEGNCRSAIDLRFCSKALDDEMRQADAAIIKGVGPFETMQHLPMDAYYAFTVHSRDSQNFTGLPRGSTVFAYVPKSQNAYQYEQGHVKETLNRWHHNRHVEVARNRMKDEYRKERPSKFNPVEIHECLKTQYGIVQPKEYRIVVEGLVFIKQKNKLLLNVRGEDAPDEVGRIEGIGGWYDEEADKDSIAALERELEEELGKKVLCNIQCLLEIRILDPIRYPETEIRQKQVILSYLCLLKEGTPTIRPEERRNVASYRIMTLDEFYKLNSNDLSQSTRMARAQYRSIFGSEYYYKSLK